MASTIRVDWNPVSLFHDWDVQESEETLIDFPTAIYPNPATSFINIDFLTELDNAAVNISIYNLLGDKILEQNTIVPTAGRNTLFLDLSISKQQNIIPSGIYLCNVSINGKNETVRFSLQR